MWILEGSRWLNRMNDNDDLDSEILVSFVASYLTYKTQELSFYICGTRPWKLNLNIKTVQSKLNLLNVFQLYRKFETIHVEKNFIYGIKTS